MKKEESIQKKTSSIIRWSGVNFNRRGLLMKQAMAVLISLTVLCCVSLDYGYAERNTKVEVYTVIELSGDVVQKSSGKDTLLQVTVGDTLNHDAVLNIVKDGTLKIKSPSGKEIVLEGPCQGELKDLVAEKRVPSGDFVKNTLFKIPALKENEKKVDISTTSAGLTRGAESPRKSMPYIWKVKKSSKKSGKK